MDRRISICGAMFASLFLVTACNHGDSTSTVASTTTSTTTSNTTSGSTSGNTATAAAAGSVSLSAANYQVPTSSGLATVTVNRRGSAQGSMSVQFTTANGSAVAGSDYAAVQGTLTWASGDSTSKSVVVPIGKNSDGKKFVFWLTNAINASLGNPNGATIEIPGAVSPGAGPRAVNGLSVRVQGNHLIDATGTPLQLRGVNVAGLEFVAVQGWNPSDPWGTGGPSWSAIKTWQSNVVRLPLNEASWLGYLCVDGSGATRDPDPGHNYRVAVKKAVLGATAAGLYVILDLHWTAPKNFCPLAQNPMADTDNSINFWSSIASTYKDYPNVLFELFNEPFIFWTTAGESEWDVLMKGGTLTQYVTGDGANYTKPYTWQVAGMQQLLDTVRGTGATNVVLVSGVTWSQDLSQWVATRPRDAIGQLAAVWHAYPNSGTVGDLQAALPKFGNQGYAWTQAVLRAGFPVVITEFGDHNAADTVGSPFVSKLLPWADEQGASYVGWTWNPWQERDNVLLKTATGVPSDGYGEYVKQHYLCISAGGSNCP